MNQFDILLDVLVVNQTKDTLQNLTLELSTLGDLRLVEKPSPLTIAPQDFANIKANIKVSLYSILCIIFIKYCIKDIIKLLRNTRNYHNEVFYLPAF